MPLTEKQIEEYREKLRDSEYMERTINGIAGKLLTGPVIAAPYAEPEINDTEEKEMAKNSLYDLADHLFERIEWVTDRDIKGAELMEEIKRNDAVVKASVQILNIANTIVRAKTAVDNANGKMKLPTMLEDKTK
jgi:hypothetical protein